MQRLFRYIAWLFAPLAGLDATPAHAGGEPPSYARAFELAFQPGWQSRLGDASVGFHIFDAGRLRLTSGRIKACDPFVGMEHRAFTAAVPKGGCSRLPETSVPRARNSYVWPGSPS